MQKFFFNPLTNFQKMLSCRLCWCEGKNLRRKLKYKILYHFEKVDYLKCFKLFSFLGNRFWCWDSESWKNSETIKKIQHHKSRDLNTQWNRRKREFSRIFILLLLHLLYYCCKSYKVNYFLDKEEQLKLSITRDSITFYNFFLMSKLRNWFYTYFLIAYSHSV